MEHILLNKEITGIKIASDRKAILFEVTGGEHIAKCDGDCCSSTWVENIETPVLGFPAKVLSVENIDMPDKGQPEYGKIDYYGLKIKTDKGDIILDYRNESNGYYGGNLCWNDEDFYGGVHGQNESTLDWQVLGNY